MTKEKPVDRDLVDKLEDLIYNTVDAFERLSDGVLNRVESSTDRTADVVENLMERLGG